MKRKTIGRINTNLLIQIKNLKKDILNLMLLNGDKCEICGICNCFDADEDDEDYNEFMKEKETEIKLEFKRRYG